jgi:hypothetical protein
MSPPPNPIQFDPQGLTEIPTPVPVNPRGLGWTPPKNEEDPIADKRTSAMVLEDDQATERASAVAIVRRNVKDPIADNGTSAIVLKAARRASDELTAMRASAIAKIRKDRKIRVAENAIENVISPDVATILLNLAATRAAFAAAAAAAEKLPPPKPKELVNDKYSAIADPKRSDIEKIILSKSNGLQYDPKLYSPTEREIIHDWAIRDFFGTSYRGCIPFDINVTNPDYLPTTKDKYSQSTCPTCPLEYNLSPEVFVDNIQEVLCYAQRSNTTIWCKD